MSSGVRYVFWFIAVLALNYCVIPFSLWLHHANIELTGKTWIAVALLILVNVSSVQVYLAIRHELQKYYIVGLYAVMGIVVSFLVLAQLTTPTYFILVLAISIATALILLILQLREVRKLELEAEKRAQEGYQKPNPKPLPKAKPKKHKKRKK